MKKFLTLASLLCCSYTTSFAQKDGECGFDDYIVNRRPADTSTLAYKKYKHLRTFSLDKIKRIKKADFMANSFAAFATSDFEYRHVPIAAHIVRRSDASDGFPVTELEAAIKILNQTYNTFNFHFTLCSIEFIDSDNLYNFRHNVHIELVNPAARNVPGKLNIYFVPNATRNGTFQSASANQRHITMTNGGAMVTNNISGAAILRHEVGHWFGLRHTHNGIDSDNKELVNGTNCATAGDYICDTPADPNLSGNVNSDCEYTGTATDPNGDIYHPMVNNFMAYSGKCRDAFTDDQVKKMHANFLNLEDIRGITLTPCYEASTEWKRMTGSDADDIAYSNTGTLLITNTVNRVYAYRNEDWVKLPITVNFSSIPIKRLAVNDNVVYGIATNGKIYKNILNMVQQMPGSDGQDIAVETDGTAWLVNTVGKIYKFQNNDWVIQPGSDAVRIAAGGSKVCIVNTIGIVYHLVEGSWEKIPGVEAQDIAVNEFGTIWVTGKNNKIYGYNGQGWYAISGSDAVNISANNHRLYITNTAGRIYELRY